MSDKLINYSLLYWERIYCGFQVSITFIHKTAIRYVRPTKYILSLLPYATLSGSCAYLRFEHSTCHTHLSLHFNRIPQTFQQLKYIQNSKQNSATEEKQSGADENTPVPRSNALVDTAVKKQTLLVGLNNDLHDNDNLIVFEASRHYLIPKQKQHIKRKKNINSRKIISVYLTHIWKLKSI